MPELRSRLPLEPAPEAITTPRDLTSATQRSLGSAAAADSPEQMLRRAQHFADRLARRPASGNIEAPLAELGEMAGLGLLAAPLPTAAGGLGLGTEPGTHLPLLRLLATLGGADLVLGRLYEGHVNALILIALYGSEAQQQQAALDAHAGLLFGVWNTGSADLLQLHRQSDGTYLYAGGKTFASGASFVQRPIVTAQLGDEGWQMTLPRMEAAEIATHINIDRSFWRPLGMEATESFAIDFNGATLEPRDLIGDPGDYYRDPVFRGGAVRFAAVHAGAILRLHRMFAEWLQTRGRAEDPYQVARLGETALAAQNAVLWIERAAAVSEAGFKPGADKLAAEAMLECANMTRLGVESLATSTMGKITAGIGAHGLLQSQGFEQILRNLTMYLRQPSPDQALADVGRASLRKASLRADGAVSGLWQQESNGTMPAAYFDGIYQRSLDPWDFETSEYEAAKYRHTLEALPLPRFHRALEIGCSIGVLTEQLATRCESLLSVDLSERALEVARARCRHLPQVRFRCLQIPAGMPDGPFDLVVLSEVAYYWELRDLDRAATLIAERQTAGAYLILVHYTPLVPDYPLTGDQVHEAWLRRPEWKPVRQERCERYRLDVLERRG